MPRAPRGKKRMIPIEDMTFSISRLVNSALDSEEGGGGLCKAKKFLVFSEPCAQLRLPCWHWAPKYFFATPVFVSCFFFIIIITVSAFACVCVCVSGRERVCVFGKFRKVRENYISGPCIRISWFTGDLLPHISNQAIKRATRVHKSWKVGYICKRFVTVEGMNCSVSLSVTNSVIFRGKPFVEQPSMVNCDW